MEVNEQIDSKGAKIVNFKKFLRKNRSPKHLVIGQGRAAKNILRILKTKFEDVSKVSPKKDLERIDFTEIRSVHVIEPNFGLRMDELVSFFRKKCAEKTMITAIVPDYKDDFSERKLLRVGADVVFEWPRESSLYMLTIGKIEECFVRRKKNEDDDEALKNSLQLRMKVMAKGINPKNLGIYVYRGIVILEGIVETAQSIKYLKQRIEATPGVKGVMANSLKVGPTSELKPHLQVLGQS